MSVTRAATVPAAIGAAAIGAALLLGGCLLRPGPEELERLIEHRGRVYSTVVFSRQPGEDERPIEELRRTLDYWTASAPPGAAPRWRGILVPDRDELYRDLARAIDDGAPSITLRSYIYDGIGIDALTLVDYLDGSGTLIGYDSVAYQPPLEKRRAPATVGWDDMAWWEWPQLVIDVPVALVIGVKELAFEIVKSPFSAIESGFHGTAFERRLPMTPVTLERAALGFVEDWRNGIDAFTWRFRVRRRHTPLDTFRDLLGAVPLVGPLFDHKTPPAGPHGPVVSRGPDEIIVTQGIHADSASEQMIHPLEAALREAAPPDVEVWTSPYRYGGVADVVWSLFNFSNGFGYDLARDIVFHRGVAPGESVEIVGFSGGAQRAVVASRALRHAGVTVDRIVGIAGPVNGFSCARESHLLLARNFILDPVVLAARVTEVLYPFPSNVQIHAIPSGGPHNTPYLPHPETRAPFLAYDEALERVRAAEDFPPDDS